MLHGLLLTGSMARLCFHPCVYAVAPFCQTSTQPDFQISAFPTSSILIPVIPALFATELYIRYSKNSLDQTNYFFFCKMFQHLQLVLDNFQCTFYASYMLILHLRTLSTFSVVLWVKLCPLLNSYVELLTSFPSPYRVLGR